MLQDSFVETSVKRKNGISEVLFNTFIITTAIIAVFFAFLIPIYTYMIPLTRLLQQLHLNNSLFGLSLVYISGSSFSNISI